MKKPKDNIPVAVVKVTITAEFPLETVGSLDEISEITSMLNDALSNFRSVGSATCTLTVPSFTAEIK
jgi:hypothetical protein